MLLPVKGEISIEEVLLKRVIVTVEYKINKQIGKHINKVYYDLKIVIFFSVI